MGTRSALTPTLPNSADFAYATPPGSGWTLIDPTTFAPVFAANASLDKVPIFNLMALPGITDPTALAEALAYCEAKRAFFIMDAPANAVADTLPRSFRARPIPRPWPTSGVGARRTAATPAPPRQRQRSDLLPVPADDRSGDRRGRRPHHPSGFVAGICAREDNNRGVWKSPAGLETTILGTTGVVAWGVMTDPQQGVAQRRLASTASAPFPGSAPSSSARGRWCPTTRPTSNGSTSPSGGWRCSSSSRCTAA